MSEEFYIGYLPKAPGTLAKLIRRIVLCVCLSGLAASAILVSSQAPFAPAVFEYGVYRDYEGEMVERPYPMLLTGAQRFLLVAPGKHGASALVPGMDGQRVRFRASLIHRGEDRMLELLPESVQTVGRQQDVRRRTDLGPVTLSGEIVDSKCYFGVMNPGSGKVHRDCAVRCISGGIPPAFIARDETGGSYTMLLTGSDGRPLSREILDFVGEPVSIAGQVERVGATLFLRAEPNSIRRE